MPTVVTDKNGKITTVHKRQQSSASRVDMPPPAAKKSPKQAAKEAMDRLKANNMDLFSSPSNNAVFFYLAATAHTEIMERLVSAAENCPSGEERNVWMRVIGDSVVPTRGTLYWNTGWMRYQHLDALVPLAVSLEADGRHGRYYKQADRLIDKVMYSFTQHHQDREFLQAAAIVLHLNDENNPMKRDITVKDAQKYLPEIEFISTHIENVKKILPALGARGKTDRGTVEALISSASPSLAQGAL